MAKFKNLHSESGKIKFGENRIVFSGFLETEDKKLIKQLSENAAWVKVEESTDDLKALKEEAKELEVKFQANISYAKLKEKVDEAKAELEELEDEFSDEDETSEETSEEDEEKDL